MIYNFATSKVEQLKILNLHGSTITKTTFGPFDNGYLLLGLSSGTLLALDLPEFEIVAVEKLFPGVPISNICYEPTNLVFVSSENKQVVALNLL